jgi:tetratricopeptide (TPR) repeat protein
VSRFRTIAGHNLDGIALAEQAIQMAEELGDHELLADVLNTRGIARSNIGHDGWHDDLARSLSLALEKKSWRAGRAYINFGDVLLNNAGAIADAEKLMREGLAFAENLGILLAVRWSRGNLADALFHLGRWDEALGLMEIELNEPESHYLQPLSRRNRSYIRLARGDDRGAREDSDAGMLQSRAIRDPQDLIPALVSRAFLCARVGDASGAHAALDELSATQDESEQPDVYGPSTIVLASALLELGRGGDLERLLRSELASPWQEVGRAIAAGDGARAADALESMGARTFEAQVRLLSARALREAGRRSEAGVQLQRSLAFYRSVGATRYLREGEALLDAAS